ncbi:hypothetical protein G9A89_015520 [Geosiphon pyriformis]|nr:hypothetical protein G9A89_015520 [Geosiphon pyriformis]
MSPTSTKTTERPEDGQSAPNILVEEASLYQKMFADRGPNKRKIKMRQLEQIPLEGADDDSEYEVSPKDPEETDTDDATIVSGGNSAQEGEVCLVVEAEQQPTAEIEAVDPEDTEALIKEFLKKWKIEDPGVCCICLESATSESNMLVYCDGDECEVVCHQECYGIIHLPASDEPWYCDRCLAPPSEYVSCALCPNKNGAFRRLKNGESSGSWVHLVCALWMPGMWVGDTYEMTDITVEGIEHKNWTKPCSVCPEEVANEGAKIHCDAGGCKNFIHVSCAHSMSLLECVEDDPNISDPYFAYCPNHGSELPSRLNEWERWYRKRDKFLGQVRKKENVARGQNLSSDDVGFSLREIFEHQYSDYRKSRETRIAGARRRVAEVTSVVHKLKDQKEKYEKSIPDTRIKIENARKESEALQDYLNSVRESLQLCSRAIYHFPMKLNRPENNSNRDRDTVDQFIDLLSRPVVWEPAAAMIARRIDINKLDNAIIAPLGILPPTKTTAPVTKTKKKPQKRKIRSIKGQKQHNGSQTVVDIEVGEKESQVTMTSKSIATKTCDVQEPPIKPPPKKKGRKSNKQKELEEQERLLAEQQAQKLQGQVNLRPLQTDLDILKPIKKTRGRKSNKQKELEEQQRLLQEQERLLAEERARQLVDQGRGPYLKDTDFEMGKKLENPRESPTVKQSSQNDIMWQAKDLLAISQQGIEHQQKFFIENPIGVQHHMEGVQAFVGLNPYKTEESVHHQQSSLLGQNISNHLPQQVVTGVAPSESPRNGVSRGYKRRQDKEIRDDDDSSPKAPKKVRVIKRKRVGRPGRPKLEKTHATEQTNQDDNFKTIITPPQPICVVCNLVDVPQNDQASATYVTPSKARATSLINGRDKVHRMVRCNFCERWFHLACMNPPRKTMPTHGFIWQCEECDPEWLKKQLEAEKTPTNGLFISSSAATNENSDKVSTSSEGATPTASHLKWRLRSSHK